MLSHDPASTSGPYRALVFGDSSPAFLVVRTLRALQSQDVCGDDLSGLPPQSMAERLADGSAPVWFIRSGSWPARYVPRAALPRSGTGHALCALGATLAAHGMTDHAEAAAWKLAIAATGGSFHAGGKEGDSPIFADTKIGTVPRPPLDSFYLDSAVLAAVISRLKTGLELTAAVLAELSAAGRRVVRVAALDVHRDTALRVAQVVTTLQRGGAERIALDLHRALEAGAGHSLLITLGQPTRAPFPTPPSTCDVSRAGPHRAARIPAALRAVRAFAADVVHGHLLDAPDIRQFGAAGIPLVVTIHNMRPGWPEGLDTLAPGDAALLVACARAVEEELRTVFKGNSPDSWVARSELQAKGVISPLATPFARSSETCHPGTVPAIPVRTIWNAVDFGACRRTPAVQEAACALRRRLGIAAGAFVLVALANPRPQKRMERLPAVVAATRKEFERRNIDREVALLVAGEPSRASPTATAAEAAIRAAIDEHRLDGHVHFLGAVEEVPVALAASDALVCVSGYEGLSLAHVEALAAEVPVVATAVGGTAELAWGNPAFRLLSADATPHEFAVVLADIAAAPPPNGRAAAERDFNTARMAAGYRRLYAAAIHAHQSSRHVPRAVRPVAGNGLWLVTNNFSTGGAQSSAARLLRGLAAEGIPARAAIIQEQPDYPTPGRRRLEEAGIPVLALPPPGTIDPADAVMELLEHIAAAPPQAVLLWNVIPEYKVLLADVLLDVPLFDVSPGEMYFASLERYFCNPRPGLPYRTAREYGARLAGVIVKYKAEARLAAERLGAPVHVVPNGVPLQSEPAAHSPSLLPSPSGRGAGGEGCVPPRPALVLGTAARIAPQKKLEDLLLAVRTVAGRLPPYELRIAGGPENGAEDYARQLREMAAGLNVRWLGDVEDTAAFYRDLDLFAMISEPAGCPNASLEAMSAGLPVVCTDVGGAAEQVIDGCTGRVVPRGDAAALGAAILDYARDPQLRAFHGAAGRQRIAGNFDVARMVSDYRRIIGLDAPQPQEANRG
jgi:glycosyltransferase involved in cell wall biosynthesis